MFVFVIYALAIWWGAVRWRRRPAGFAVVVIGLIGLLLVAKLHLMLNEWTAGGIYLPVLQVLLYPYTGLVVLTGLFLASLPRVGPVAAQGVTCGSCHYDLTGLENAEGELRCPECGRVSLTEQRRFADAQRERFAARRAELGRQLGLAAEQPQGQPERQQ